MEIWHVWVILGIILLIFEIYTPGFLLASLALGAFAAALISAFDGAAVFQLIAFAAGTLAVFFGIRPSYMRFMARFDDSRRLGLEALIGRECRVLEAILNAENRGRIQIGGENWRARSLEDEPIAENEIVIVHKIEGVTAYVTKAKKEA